MRYQEILEACWKGYQQQGMKKKGERQVPNCVPVAEVNTGPEITGKDLLFKAAAMAMRDASHEGISLDYEQAIRQASKIYGIPYTPSELPKLLAQRVEIDRQLALLKQGKQVAKARRQEKLAPTPAGAEEYWKTHALPTDRIKPATKTLEAIEEDLKKWFKEKWVRFGPDGKIRGDCARGSSKEGKPKCLPQSKAHALGKKGRASAAAKKRREDPNPERRGPAKNVATKVKEVTDKTGGQMYQHQEVYMVVHNGKEVAFYKPANMKQAYHDAQELVNKFGGEAHVKKVMREQSVKEPIPAKSVIRGYTVFYNPNTKVISITVGGTDEQAAIEQARLGTTGLKNYRLVVDKLIDRIESAEQLDEKQDACYSKVKSRYKVWPSAYASGALVQCRKKGAANWGNKGKK